MRSVQRGSSLARRSLSATRNQLEQRFAEPGREHAATRALLLVEPDSSMLSVGDTGPGIPEEHLPLTSSASTVDAARKAALGCQSSRQS